MMGRISLGSVFFLIWVFWAAAGAAQTQQVPERGQPSPLRKTALAHRPSNWIQGNNSGQVFNAQGRVTINNYAPLPREEGAQPAAAPQQSPKAKASMRVGSAVMARYRGLSVLLPAVTTLAPGKRLSVHAAGPSRVQLGTSYGEQIYLHSDGRIIVTSPKSLDSFRQVKRLDEALASVADLLMEATSMERRKEIFEALCLPESYYSATISQVQRVYIPDAQWVQGMVEVPNARTSSAALMLCGYSYRASLFSGTSLTIGSQVAVKNVGDLTQSDGRFSIGAFDISGQLLPGTLPFQFRGTEGGCQGWVTHCFHYRASLVISLNEPSHEPLSLTTESGSGPVLVQTLPLSDLRLW